MKGPATLVCKNFVDVTDPRSNRGRNHDLLEMVFIALTATICGADGWADIERFAKAKLSWFRRYIKLEHGVPSHDTFGRVFSRLDTGEFLTAMHAWVDKFAGALRGQGIAIDGKVLRGSFDTAAERSPLHTITAFDANPTLSSTNVGGRKEQRDSCRSRVAQAIGVGSATVTLDAMHCQTETARAIVEAGADYVLTVKRNQESLYQELADLFVEYGEQDNQVDGLRKHVTVEKGHGRNERREYFAIDAPETEIFSRWQGIRSVGMIYRHREGRDMEHDETMFFISSLPPKVKRLSSLIRDHWKIENSEHYVLDVTFSEDASRIRKGTSPEISAAFRRMALNVLQHDTTLKDSIRGKRLLAGWDDDVLDAIYAGFNTA